MLLPYGGTEAAETQVSTEPVDLTEQTKGAEASNLGLGMMISFLALRGTPPYFPPWAGDITPSAVLSCPAGSPLLHCSCCGCLDLPCVWWFAVPRGEGEARYGGAVKTWEAEAGSRTPPGGEA